MKCVVFNIQRFCINDGPGIRTTVFLKGCVLNCIWCHNPESKSFKPEIMFHDNKCVGCNKCFIECSNHKLGENGTHIIDRESCTNCEKCVQLCSGALEMCGKYMTAEEVMEEVIKDKNFYNNSNGGLTISGGEPLCNFEFTKELLKIAKKLGIHTCIETCGYCDFNKILEIVPYVDIFLWDIKETDNILHREYTGVENIKIINNLFELNKLGSKIILRCPIIPNCNARIEHYKKIGELAESLDNVIQIDIEPYHSLGKTKSKEVGKKYMLDSINFLDEEEISRCICTISKYTSKPIKANR